MSYPIHNMKVTSVCPTIDGGVVDCAMPLLPELALMPNRIIEGTSITTLVRSKRASKKVFGKVCEGVCPAFDQFETKEITAMPFKDIIQMCTHALMGQKDDFGAGDAFDMQAESTLINLFEQGVAQLYGGHKYCPSGFPGFPDIAGMSFDALKADVNCTKDYTTGEGPDFDIDLTTNPQFTTVYLVRRATSENDKHGVRWVFGGGSGITMGDRMQGPIIDPNKSDFAAKPPQLCYTQGITQFLEGFWGLQCKTPYDVVEICNVPMFCLDGFFLDKILTRIVPKFPGNCKPNAVLLDDEFTGIWINSRRDGNGGCCLKELEGPLGDRIQTLDSFTSADGASTSLPIIRSQCIPLSTYQEKPDDTCIAGWRKTWQMPAIADGGGKKVA